MDRREQERALVGAALVDESVARLLFSELGDDEFLDPTARLACWALRRAYEPGSSIAAELEKAAREREAAMFWAAVDGHDAPGTDDTAEPMTDVDIVIDTLIWAGLLAEAGGTAAISALVEDRPALRAALVAGRAAVAGIRPVTEEPLVAFAAALLAG